MKVSREECTLDWLQSKVFLVVVEMSVQTAVYDTIILRNFVTVRRIIFVSVFVFDLDNSTDVYRPL